MGTHPIFESDFDCLTENEMAKGVKRQQGFTASEEQLLAGFSRTTSGKGTAVFWIHALYVAAIPIWIQTRIHQYSIADHLVYLIIGTIAQAVALHFAYKNVKFVSKEKIATLRSDAIANEVSNAVGKQINRQELDDRILHRKNEVAENESLHYSIFYNNAIYLTMYLLFSIVFFKNSTPLTNYIISAIISSGFVAGISNTK